MGDWVRSSHAPDDRQATYVYLYKMLQRSVWSATDPSLPLTQPERCRNQKPAPPYLISMSQLELRLTIPSAYPVPFPDRLSILEISFAELAEFD